MSIPNAASSRLGPSQIKPLLCLGRMQFAVLNAKKWWRLCLVAHLLGAIVGTSLIAMAARLIVLQGGFGSSSKTLMVRGVKRGSAS